MDINVRDKASEWSSMAGNAFSSLRDRFTGNRGNNDNYDDGYDEYGYDEYGYDDNAVETYSAYDNPYDEYAYNYEEDAPKAPAYGGSGSNGGVKYPSLVTAEDIRVSTQATERLRRENAAAGLDSSAAPRYSTNRTNVAYVNPAYDPAMNGPVTNNEGAIRSRGYDSLFTSTTSASSRAAERPAVDDSDERITTRPAGYVSATATPAANSYDPYAAYQGAGSASHAPTRTLQVIAPISYGEVEEVSRALKAGDVVVLQLKRTSSDLSKRILDFSFGVASALDARVDCVADKVFVIARGNALTTAEKQSLVEQGVL